MPLPSPLLVQGLVAGAALACAILPVGSAAALYLPMPQTSAADALHWSRAEGATLLGTGPYRGALVLHRPAPGATWRALRHGALLLPIPEFLCGSDSRDQTARPS